MKKWIAVLTIFLLMTGCGKLDEATKNLDQLKEMSENVKEMAEEVSENLEESAEIFEEQMAAGDNSEGESEEDSAETSDQEKDDPGAESESLGYRDTSSAMVIEDGQIYTGQLEPGEQAVYLFEDEGGAPGAFLVKNHDQLIGLFQEVKENENANSGFYLSEDEGIFTRDMVDGSELFTLKNETSMSIEYALLAIHGDANDMKRLVRDLGGLKLSSEKDMDPEGLIMDLDGAVIAIDSVRFFAEDEGLGIPRYDDTLFMLTSMQVTNLLDEPMVYEYGIYESFLDMYGHRLGNASNWIEDNGSDIEIGPGESAEIKRLYALNTDSDVFTLRYEVNESKDSANYLVDISDIVTKANEEEAAADAAESIMLIEKAKEIIGLIDENRFEEMVGYGDFVMIANGYEHQLFPDYYQGFEEGHWLEADTYEMPLDFGIDTSGQMITMTIMDFFDQYITDFDYVGTGTSSLFITRDMGDERPEWADPYNCSHYVLFEAADGINAMAVLFDEVGPKEYELTAIRTFVQ